MYLNVLSIRATTVEFVPFAPIAQKAMLREGL